jgi:hypothetical protein
VHQVGFYCIVLAASSHSVKCTQLTLCHKVSDKAAAGCLGT